jgi:transcription termination/antitermination protein NusG
MNLEPRSKSEITTNAVDVAAEAHDRWYALRTRSRHEKKVRDQLLRGQVETFLPLCERWSRWKDRTKRLDFPLFPGYCFARFQRADRWRIANVHGVAEVLGARGTAEAIPDSEIDALRRLVASRFRFDPHPFLEEGMEVEIVRGPLAGVRGKLLRKDGITRIVLAVTLIRQAVVVHVHPADVARV